MVQPVWCLPVGSGSSGVWRCCTHRWRPQRRRIVDHVDPAFTVEGLY